MHSVPVIISFSDLPLQINGMKSDMLLVPEKFRSPAHITVSRLLTNEIYLVNVAMKLTKDTCITQSLWSDNCDKTFIEHSIDQFYVNFPKQIHSSSQATS